MKPNNAGEDANQKLKQNAQTQDADGMQAKSMLYKTHLYALFGQTYFSWEGGRSEPPPPHFSADAPGTRHAAL